MDQIPGHSYGRDLFVGEIAKFVREVLAAVSNDSTLSIKGLNDDRKGWIKVKRSELFNKGEQLGMSQDEVRRIMDDETRKAAEEKASSQTK